MTFYRKIAEQLKLFVSFAYYFFFLQFYTTFSVVESIVNPFSWMLVEGEQLMWYNFFFYFLVLPGACLILNESIGVNVNSE